MKELLMTIGLLAFALVVRSAEPSAPSYSPGGMMVGAAEAAVLRRRGADPEIEYAKLRERIVSLSDSVEPRELRNIVRDVEALRVYSMGLKKVGKIDRLHILVLWLKLLDKLDPLVKPVNMDDAPELNVAPPLGGGPAGIAPSAIKDPVKRKAYEEALAENAQKARTALRQGALRNTRNEALESFRSQIDSICDNDPEKTKMIKSVIEKEVSNNQRKRQLLRYLSGKKAKDEGVQ